MSALLPNQSRILAAICSQPAVLAEVQLGIPRATVDIFLENCRSFVQSNAAHLEHAHYAFELSPTTCKGNPVSFSDVLKASTVGKPVLVVSENLLLSRSAVGSVKVTGACEETKSSSSIRVLVHGTYIYVVLSGQAVAESDALGPSKNPPAGSMFDRPASEIPTVVREHFAALVAKEKGFKYWHDPGKRVLVASPESTERLFQRSLFVWMDSHILDKLRVYAEPRGMGQDATDVTVVTVAGEHIIEVKWLGKNVNKTEYKQERINEGLRQVAIYLNNDPRAICGYVVIYDARPRDKHENESTYDQAAQHQRCECPMVLFLENETPSQAAKLKSAEGLLALDSPNGRATNAKRAATTSQGKKK